MNDSHDVNFKTFTEKYMSTITQKESVLNEVKSILGDSFDATMPAKEQLSSEQLITLKANIVNGIIAGSVSFNKDTTDEKEIAKYVSGMVSNHFRKAKELNGNSSYVPQTTGKGSKDSQVSELSKLLKTFEEGTDEYEQIVTAISARKLELSAEKLVQAKERKKQKELSSINTEVLPEGLKDLANSLVSNAA